ncbi:MAG: hypothetical protein ABL928_00210 [Sphingorhabdus sp.]
MAEAKPFASLSSGLLARKGDARPAMRRQMNNGTVETSANVHDDLGWNDMGYDVNPDHNAPMDHDHEIGHNPLAAAVPEVKPEVKAQQDRIAEQLHVQAEQTEALHYDAPPAPVVSIVTAKPVAVAAATPKAKTPRAEPGMKAKSAFTLRLDGDRHLRLRLACAVSNRSAQQLVTAALDAFIESMPEIGALAAQLPPQKSQNSHRN